MMVVVTLVSTVVHIYSNYYMEHDESFNRFFSIFQAFRLLNAWDLVME